jgi:predicted secreted protein
MPRIRALLCLFLLLAPIAGAGQTAPTFNRVQLGESARADVENDLLVAVLFAQAEGRDPAIPADEVNRLMDWALNLAKSHPEVKVQTLNYQTNPVYTKDKIRAWRVRQSLRLESRDSRVLGDLVGRLQESLQMESLSYQVSDERRRSHTESLTATALQRFEARARHIAQTLGRSGYRIVQIRIDDAHRPPMPVARGMLFEAAVADSAPAPARIEAGTSEIGISISGEIELSEN